MALLARVVIGAVLATVASSANPNELFEKGRIAFDAKREQDAHQYFDLCVDADPKHSECLFHLGLVHRRMASGKDTTYKKVQGMEGIDFQRSSFEVAITAFTHAVAHTKDSTSAARYLTAMVEALDATGQYEAAADAGMEALRADSKNLEVATMLAATLQKQGRWKEAEKIWKHVIALHAVADAKAAKEEENGSGMGWDLEDEDEGVEGDLVHEVPFASSIAKVRLGSVLHALGRHHEAKEALEQGLRDVPATCSIVDSPTKLQAEGEKQAAAGTIDQQGGWPTDPWWQLGDIAQRSEDFSLAADSMAKAVQRYPNDFSLLTMTAEVSHRQGAMWTASLLQRQGYVRYFGWLRQPIIDIYPDPHALVASETFDRIFRYTSTSKLRHDALQLQHLISRSRSWGESKAGEMQRTIEEFILPAYMAMIKERQQQEEARSDGGPVQEGEEYPLSAKWWKKVGRFYNRATHTADWVAKNVTAAWEDEDGMEEEDDEEEEEEEGQADGAAGKRGDEEDAATTAGDVTRLIFGEGSGGRSKVLTLHEQLALGVDTLRPLQLRWDVVSRSADAGAGAGAGAAANVGTSDGSVQTTANKLNEGRVFAVDGMFTPATLSSLFQYFQQATIWHYPASPKVAGDKSGTPDGGGYVRSYGACLASDLLVQLEVALAEMLAGLFPPEQSKGQGQHRWRLASVVAAKRVPPSHDGEEGTGAVALLELQTGAERAQMQTQSATMVSEQRRILTYHTRSNQYALTLFSIALASSKNIHQDAIRVTVRVGGAPQKTGFSLEDVASGLVFRREEGAPIRVPLWHNRALVYDAEMTAGAHHYHLLGQQKVGYQDWPVDLTFLFERQESQ
jgi:tetratricopeptide (TPR) repeat protein